MSSSYFFAFSLLPRFPPNLFCSPSPQLKLCRRVNFLSSHLLYKINLQNMTLPNRIHENLFTLSYIHQQPHRDPFTIFYRKCEHFPAEDTRCADALWQYFLHLIRGTRAANYTSLFSSVSLIPTFEPVLVSFPTSDYSSSALCSVYFCDSSFQSLLFITYILMEPTALLCFHRKHRAAFLISDLGAKKWRRLHGPPSPLQPHSVLQQQESRRFHWTFLL